MRTTEIYARASKLAISRHILKLRDTFFSNGRDLLVDGQPYGIDATMADGGKLCRPQREAVRTVGD